MGNKAAEHVFPQWLQKRVGATNTSILNTIEDLATGSQQDYTNTFGSFVAKRVCANCNCKWMNDLEVAIAPILEPIFRGLKANGDLTESEQAIVARWSIKTALAAFAARPLREAVVPQEHYRLLTRGEPLPAGLHIVGVNIGATTDRCGFFMSGRISLLADKLGSTIPPSEMRDSYSIGFQFGNLVICVLHCSAPTHVACLNANYHCPIGRPFSHYVWYSQGNVPAPIFEGDIEFWNHLVGSIGIAKPPVWPGDIISFGSNRHAVTTTPRFTSFPKPPCIATTV